MVFFWWKVNNKLLEINLKDNTKGKKVKHKTFVSNSALLKFDVCFDIKEVYNLTKNI